MDGIEDAETLRYLMIMCIIDILEIKICPCTNLNSILSYRIYIKRNLEGRMT